MISQLKIVNYKSICYTDLKLLPINILIGANGAGKSNFISFFKLLKNLYEQNLQNFIASELGAENILYFGLKESEYLSGTIFFSDNSYHFKLKPDLGGNLYFEQDQTQFQGGSYTSPYVEPLGNGHKESLLKQSKARVSIYVKSYMETFRIFHFHDTSSTSKIRMPGKIHDNDFFKEDGSNLAAFLYKLQETAPKTLKKIEMQIKSVAPFFDRFNLKPDRINTEMIRLEWKEKESDNYFNATNLSDGTIRFIALATLLLQERPPKTIIIDEPELGLHPFAINKLAGLIKKASQNSQIIISTQSVNLVDQFTPEDIITVDRGKDGSIFNRQQTENLKNWLTEYSLGDIWSKNVIGGRP